jgi:Uma2 family endonuclease
MQLFTVQGKPIVKLYCSGLVQAVGEISMQSLLENAKIRESVLRLDVDQYHRLCNSGIIPERTELLEGVVVEKMGKSPLHSWTVGFLEEWFRTHLPPDLFVRVEQPLTIGASEPEPDLAVIAGHRGQFRDQHPTTASLVVEVAITTVELDRAKADIYSQAGVAEYLLVLPKQRQVIAYGDLSNGVYQSIQTLNKEATISLMSLCRASLDLSQLFPD